MKHIAEAGHFCSHPRRGAASVLIIILGLVLVGFLALAIDTAYVRKTAQELQAAADAAALAAALKVVDDDPATQFAVTRQAAIDLAAANEAANAAAQLDANLSNTVSGDIVVGRWDRFAGTFTPDTTAPDAVQVTARRTQGSLGGRISLFFGQIFGSGTSGVSRTAIAHYGTGGSAAIVVLDPTLDGALELKGNAELDVPNNGIQVNSNHACALHLNGQPDIPRMTARRIRVVGNYCIPSGASKPDPTPNSPYMPDPYAGLPYPDFTTMVDRGSIAVAGTYEPGYYPGGIDFNNGTAFLNPGVYYLGPPGVELNGDAYLDGDEVMLFIGIGGDITIAGNAPGLELTAPASGTFQGVCIFQHRSNPLATEISGSGNFEVVGAMYSASGHLEMDGNVDRRVGVIIYNTQLLRGNGRYTITGEGGPPTGPISSYLVQ